MIEITLSENNKEYEISASGHSGYAPIGEDIVCSAVTAVMTFLVSASAVTNGKLLEMKNGLISVILPKTKETELIIESFIITVDTMRIRYGKWINFSHT